MRYKSNIFLIMLVITIILIPSVYADVSDFGLEYNGEPITKISLNYPLTMTAVFKVDTNVMPFKIIANFSNLVQNSFYKQQYENIVIGANACSWDNSSERIKCGLENVIINPENATVNMNFEVYTTADNYTNYTLVHTFSIDNDQPELLSIKTDYCHEDKCYIKSNENNLMTFEFNDGSEQFVRNRVFYSFNNNKYPVHACSNGICYAYASKVCTSGQNFLTKLITVGTYKTEDDAGNPAISEIEEQFYCDSITPYSNGLGDGVSYNRHNDVHEDESSIEFIGDDSNYGLIVGATTLEIKAYVFEDGPILEGETNLSSIGGENQRVACSKSNEVPNLFICDFSVAQLKNEHMQENIEFFFYDVVNNSASTTKEITVLENAGANATTPDCINLVAGDFKPEKINRIALDLAQSNELTYPIYAPYTPEKKSGSTCQGMHINEQVINDCVITLTNGSTMPAFGNVFDDNSDIKYPYKRIDQGNYLDLGISSVALNAIKNTELICNFSFFVSNDEEMFLEPLIKQTSWDVEFMNSAFDRPGKEYTDKIKEAEKNVNSDLNQAIGHINDGLATASLLCNTKNMITNTLGNMKIALDGVDIARDLAGLASSTDPATSGPLTEMLQYFNGNEEGRAIKNEAVATLASIFDYSCLASACGLEQYLQATNSESTGAFAKLKSGYLGTTTGWGDDTVIGGGEYTGLPLTKEFFKQEVLANIGRPDLYNSVIACMSVGCLPGIAYHANKYREAECERLYCIKRQAQYGASIESCDVAKKTFTCKQVTGEMFEVPYLRDLKNLADNANHLAQNFIPTTFSQFFSSQLCNDRYKKVISGQAETIGDLSTRHIIMCEIPLSIGRYIRGQRMTNKAGSFTYPSNGIDVCEMALCNEEDESKCETNIGWIGNQLPDYGYELLDTSGESAEAHMRRLQTVRRSIDNGGHFLNAQRNYYSAIDGLRDGKITEEDKEKFESAAETMKYSYGIEIETNTDEFKTDVLGESNTGRGDRIYTHLINGIRDGRAASKGAGVGQELEFPFTPLPQGVTEKNAVSEHMLDQFFKGETESEEAAGTTESEVFNQMFTADKLEPELSQEKIIKHARWIAKGDPLTLGENEQKNYLKQNRPSYAKEYSDEEWKNIVDCLYDSKCYNDKSCAEDDKVCKLTKNFIKESEDNHESNTKTIQERENEIREREQFLNKRKTIVGLIDIGVKWLWNNYLEDLGTLDNLRDKWAFAGEVSDFFNEFINSESWKNSLCNPESGGIYNLRHGGNDQIDDVLECTDSVCKPVISMAMEKAEYNQTNEGETDYYIYTLVYYVGPVKQDYKYNIKFYYSNGDSYCVYQDDETDECLSDELIAGEQGEDSTEMAVAFVSPNDYEKMCIEFNKPYPSIEAQGTSAGTNPKTKYCRDIVLNAFYTGDPDLEYDETEGASSSGSSTAVFG